MSDQTKDHHIAPIVWPDLINIDPDTLDSIGGDLLWEDLQPGVKICMLHGDRLHGCSTALLNYQPGTAIPRHTHTGHEHLLILRGSQRDENGTYRKGTFLINKPEGNHRVTSDEGCLVLAIWESPVRFD